MTGEIDVEKLELDELKTLARDIEKAIRKRQAENFRRARDAAEAAVRTYGYSLEEIMRSSTASKAADARFAKYRNPADPNQTWSGRGRQPQWFKDAIAAGKAPESLSV
jgi:DNA-binding protein H-NS